MRAFLGLIAIAAASAQVTPPVTVLQGLGYQLGTAATTYSGSISGVGANQIDVTSGAPLGQPVGNNQPVYVNFGASAASTAGLNGNSYLTSTDRVNQQSFVGTVAYAVTNIYFQFTYNTFVAEAKYRTNIGKTTGNIACDPCTSSACNPADFNQTPQNNNGKCANLEARIFQVGLSVGAQQFQLAMYDWEGSTINSNYITYSFSITRQSNLYMGDPQIVGMQGQDFQVHGMPDEIFNMVTYPNVQVNARFTYLSEAECPDNYTACFAHPGTYISEQGFRVGNDRVHIRAGSAKKGLSVKINGKKMVENKAKLHTGSVEIVNHRRVVVKTPVAAFTMTNSDKFMNQEINIFDEKLLSLGAKRIAVKDGESFHPEVPLHGLQGQTWRNVEYPSGLEYEGSIMDYHVVDGDIYGTDFVFNKFEL